MPGPCSMSDISMHSYQSLHHVNVQRARSDGNASDWYLESIQFEIWPVLTENFIVAFITHCTNLGIISQIMLLPFPF